MRNRWLNLLLILTLLLSVICDRAMWLDHGRMQMLGPTEEVIAAYKNQQRERKGRISETVKKEYRTKLALAARIIVRPLT